ncbi:MAG: ABC transporter ATP-binding protein [Thermoflexales bacterium]|nr:ABC transporter ATP-binding protein [Thermoflexales bacterium]
MSSAGHTPHLQVTKLRKAFGGLMAVFDISFHVKAGEIVAIIGPNGAGKTTLFNLISGVFPPTEGTIAFNGQPLNGLKPHAVARLGLARTFQNVQLFSNMSVLENVMVGCHTRASYGLLNAALRLPRARREEKMIRQLALEHLARVGLESKAGENAANLPFGQQRLLEIARALATQPRLLLFDEVGSGLNRPEKDDLDRLICSIRDDGVTVLLVEHDVQFVMGISDRIIVLDYGQKIAEGTPAEIQSNERVIAAYLGDETG